MFKKRNFKKSNVLVGKEDLDNKEESNHEEEEEQEENPKKQRKNNKIQENLAVSDYRDQYKQLVNEKLSDLKYLATETLQGINENVIIQKNGQTDNSEEFLNYVQRLKQKTEQDKLDFLEIKESRSRIIQGPKKYNENLKDSCRFDYHRGLCKDFNQTGICCFGDACLFLHDRGDYKTGWELEKDWNNEQKLKAKNKGKFDDSDSEECELQDQYRKLQVPKSCPECKLRFKDPVQMNCGHFFCENCAIGAYQNNNKKCPECSIKTNGAFIDAVNVLKDMNIKRKGVIKKINFMRKEKKKDALVFSEESEENSEEEEKQNTGLEGIEIGDQELKGAAITLKRKRGIKNNNRHFESDWQIQ